MSDHAGPLHDLQYFEALHLPPCAECGSSDTAVIEAGDDPRLAQLGAATRRVKVVRYQPRAFRGPAPRYFCHGCESSF